MSVCDLETPFAANASLNAHIEEMVSKRIEQRLAEFRSEMTDTLNQAKAAETVAVSDRATIVAFSGEMDKLMAAFIIATGAAAMGMDASMFFTFWGLTALKKKAKWKGKRLSEKMITAMLPAGPAALKTSQMNMLGMGPAFFKWVMRKKNIQSLPDMIALARELGVKMVACEMSMNVMGIRRDELMEGIEFGGVATYLRDASDSKVTLFI